MIDEQLYFIVLIDITEEVIPNEKVYGVNNIFNEFFYT